MRKWKDLCHFFTCSIFIYPISNESKTGSVCASVPVISAGFGSWYHIPCVLSNFICVCMYVCMCIYNIYTFIFYFFTISHWCSLGNSENSWRRRRWLLPEKLCPTRCLKKAPVWCYFFFLIILMVAIWVVNLQGKKKWPLVTFSFSGLFFSPVLLISR